MRSTSDTPTTCPEDCRCDTCLTVWLNDLPARDGDRLDPWPLNRRSAWPTNKVRRNG